MWRSFDGVYDMNPKWLGYWDWTADFLVQLGSMRPPHITEEARKCFYKYIDDQRQYMLNYIYTGQVQDYTVFLEHLQAYRKSNPDGTKVFDKQEAYLEKLAQEGINNGFDHNKKQK